MHEEISAAIRRPDSLKSELLRLVEQAGHHLGLTRTLNAHLRYLIRHTQESDWHGYNRAVVYKSVTLMARQLGISERQIYNREQLLVETLGLFITGSGGRRYANRDTTTGQIMAGAAPVEGPARVIDGDTLDISGQRIRLYGVDAPESGQTCIRGGQSYACGKEATAYLRQLIAGQIIRCAPRDRDPYGRVVAVCFSRDGANLNQAMVQAGQALAYRRYALDHIADENTARSAQRGLWSGEFTPSWQWRKEQ